ncbi:MAG: outer membrane lipoprotein-sorting protein [Gammaproteobacteria bacterium]|nr:outer membrane lipoprotein-sorting protein [Gammaproteobacteria bacterium]
MSTDPTLIEQYFRGVVARPWTTIALSALVVISTGAFLPSLVMDTRSDAFINANEPALVYREKVEELFGLADPIVVAVTNDSETGIYNPDSLLLVQWLTEEVQRLANVDPERVVSLATEANIVGTQDGMEIEDFFEEPPTTAERVQWIRQAVEDFPLYQGNLVARDHSATLIVAELLDEFEADVTYDEILNIARQAPLGPHDQVHVAGEGAIAGYLSAYIDADAQKLNPLAAVVITIVLFVGFFTLRGAILPNLVVLGTVGSTFGLMAAFGVPFYVITNALTVSLIAMAVADSIHVFSQYYTERQRDQHASQQTLVVRALVEMWRPITLTTVTTAAGFLSLYPTSSMPPIQYFGLFGGIGVVLAWLFSVTFLPAALSLMQPKTSRAFAASGSKAALNSEEGSGRDWASQLMARVGRVVLDYPKSVVAFGVLVVGIGVAGALQVTVEEIRIANFQTDEPIYLADAAMNASMDGVYHLDVLVETDDFEGLHQSEHLARIDRLQRFLESQPGVGGTTSVVDYIKQMHRAVNENRPEAYSIPDDAFLISQLFLLYSASADPTDFEEEVDGEYRQALVRAKIDNGSYLRNRPVVLATEAYLRDEFNAPGITGTLTGRVNVDHHWVEEIGSSHANSVGFAFLAVVLVVMLLFRSVVAGLITTVPVAMAILLIYAWMGFTDVWLGVGTTMFASIAIGLCVDFTIHTVERLRDLLSSAPRDVKAAMLEMYPSTGRALFFNLIAIALGFGVLITSDVPPLTNFGTLVALAVVAAFVASVTLLPALIYLLQPAFMFSRPSVQFRPGFATASVVAIGAISLLAYSSTFADTGTLDLDELDGRQVMQAVNARDEGEQVGRDLRIELIDRRGKTRVQETRGYRRYFGEEKRTIIFYRAPANIRDTAFLTYDYPDAEVDDDQWLYLPALRKVRRISASDRGDYFLGTDFTYEEIKKENKIELSDYALTRIGHEMVNGIECIVVEGVPRSSAVAKELGYGKVVWRVDPAIWMSRSSDYWDVNGNHLKTIASPVIEQIDGVWTALEITAVNHKTRHRSVFTFSNVDYGSDVPAKLFEQRSLRRGL